MPRKRRFCIPGVVHHVMSRGIDGRDLFRDDADREKFLALLEHGIAKTGFRCYAWALMPNHYHLVVRTNEKPLSALMRTLNSKYARYYAKKYDRRGYLFQDRFKSIATQDQGYIEELLRYVHLNPLRAQNCKTMAALDRYRWCGHAVLMGGRKAAFQDVATVLKRFGQETRTARENYRSFMLQGVDREPEDWLEKVRASNRDKRSVLDHSCWVIGDREFVVKALSLDRENRLRLAQYRRMGWDLERICGFVCATFRLAPSQLRKRGHGNQRSTARKVFAYLANRELGIMCSEIARYLGISDAAVSKSLDRGEETARKAAISIVN